MLAVLKTSEGDAIFLCAVYITLLPYTFKNDLLKFYKEIRSRRKVKAILRLQNTHKRYTFLNFKRVFLEMIFFITHTRKTLYIPTRLRAQNDLLYNCARK